MVNAPTAVSLCDSYFQYIFFCTVIVNMRVDYVNGGEMFTHLYQREHFTEPEVRIYIAEIVVALERLHRVRILCILMRILLLVE